MKAGQVRGTRLTISEAIALSDWLRDEIAPDLDADGSAMVLEWSRVLKKMAGRKRYSNDFAINAGRTTAQWFADASRQYFFQASPNKARRPIPIAVRAAASKFAVGLRSRGRQKLTVTELEARLRNPGEYSIDAQRVQRIARELRYHREVEEWVARGNTVLLGPEPMPARPLDF